MIVFAGIAGICLWGLFSLLDNLKEPGLLRTAKGVVVKGCDTLDAHEDAPKLCPSFLCQKALVDRKLLAADARVEITRDSTEDANRIIEGHVVGTEQAFECVVSGVKVLGTDLFSQSPEAVLGTDRFSQRPDSQDSAQ
jgi:hypothetical protein